MVRASFEARSSRTMKVVPSSFLLSSLLVAVPSCAPAGEQIGPEDEASESSDSNLTATGRGVLATDGANYALAAPNVARELVATGVSNIPGVLTATSSSSPFAFAATLELSDWSDVSTTTF